jgi:hypothetical protein
VASGGDETCRYEHPGWQLRRHSANIPNPLRGSLLTFALAANAIPAPPPSEERLDAWSRLRRARWTTRASPASPTAGSRCIDEIIRNRRIPLASPGGLGGHRGALTLSPAIAPSPDAALPTLSNVKNAYLDYVLEHAPSRLSLVSRNLLVIGATRVISPRDLSL